MDFKLLIGGASVDGAGTMDIVNPASGRPFATCPRADEAQLNEAVTAAKAAFAEWSATPIDERRAVIAAMAEALEAGRDDMARLLTQEQGKPLIDAAGEIDRAVGFFRYFASLDLPVEIILSDDNRRVEAHRRPLGVVGAITPWNVPIGLMAFKVPAALLAGNTLVLKPAASTPLSTLMFGELVRNIVPAGVLNIIADANDLGHAMTAHPDIRKISFTGSTATGKKVMAGASDALKRITLELGGNDAAIILDDVDVPAIAPKIFQSAFMNNGQVCIAIKRVYAHERIYDTLVEELAKLADLAIVGDGLEQGTRFGPLQNRAQYEKVKQLIEDARQQGEVASGGEYPPGGGYFVRPTIVKNIANDARLVVEEQFGPVLPLIKFSDGDDVVNWANDSEYGLGGSVWSNDTQSAYQLAARIDAGTVWINEHARLADEIPFGGSKQSGIGLELGKEGLQEFTQLQIIHVPA